MTPTKAKILLQSAMTDNRPLTEVEYAGLINTIVELQKEIAELKANVRWDSKKASHAEMDDVINCICCGIDETRVQRFRASDCLTKEQYAERFNKQPEWQGAKTMGTLQQKLEQYNFPKWRGANRSNPNYAYWSFNNWFENIEIEEIIDDRYFLTMLGIGKEIKTRFDWQAVANFLRFIKGEK